MGMKETATVNGGSVDSATSPSIHTGTAKLERNRLQWVLAGCHLLWHPELRARASEMAHVRRLLVQELYHEFGFVDGGRVLERHDAAGHHTFPQWHKHSHPRPRESLPLGR